MIKSDLSNIPFSFRPGTNDEHVFRSVCIDNEYHLPDSFDPNDIIVDIGTHIGSFCYAVLVRGAKKVYGFEPDADNYQCAINNLRSFNKFVRLTPKAIWRSDVVNESMSIGRIDANLGGWSFFWGQAEGVNIKEAVSVIAFDEVIRNVTNNGKQRVRLLKIDCEGAEFSILFTSRMLHLIDNIYGEFHEIGGDYVQLPMPAQFRVSGFARFTIVELTDVLEKAGFSVTSVRPGHTNIGLFFANRHPQARSISDRIIQALRRLNRRIIR